jgi:outer membrane lipoprotein-sorting protein
VPLGTDLWISTVIPMALLTSLPRQIAETLRGCIPTQTRRRKSSEACHLKCGFWNELYITARNSVPPTRMALFGLWLYTLEMTLLRRIEIFSPSRKFGRYPEARRVHCSFGTTQAWIALLVLLSLLHPSRAFAANTDLETVLTGSRQRIEKLDYRMSGRLTRLEGNGKRTSYKFVAKAHWFPDGLRLLCEISGPGSEKTSLLLYMSVTGHATIEAVLPGQKAASPLPFERWNDPLVGTDFSIEDMVENQFFWKDQELLAPEKYGARDCFVLKSKSASQDRTYYDSVTSWIDRGILYPVHVVKTLRGTGQQKEFIYYGLRRVGGVWSATQVEAKLLGKPGSSILVIEGGSGKSNLGRKDFDISQVSAQEEK